jgi:hypothetical protein
MRPETFRKRLEVLRQRAVDAQPMAPTPVIYLEDGESDDEARVRCGVDPGRFCVIVHTVDASTQRDAP